MGSACKWGWGQTVGHESEGRSQEAARLPGRLGVSECTAGSDLASNWGSEQTCGSSRAGSRGALGSLTQWVLGVGGWGWRMHYSRVRRACEKSEVPRRATHSGTRSGGVACKKGDTEVRANGKREQRVRRWFYGWQVHRRLILSGDQSVGKGGKFVRGPVPWQRMGGEPRVEYRGRMGRAHTAPKLRAVGVLKMFVDRSTRSLTETERRGGCGGIPNTAG